MDALHIHAFILTVVYMSFVEESHITKQLGGQRFVDVHLAGFPYEFSVPEDRWRRQDSIIAVAIQVGQVQSYKHAKDLDMYCVRIASAYQA